MTPAPTSIEFFHVSPDLGAIVHKIGYLTIILVFINDFNQRWGQRMLPIRAYVPSGTAMLKSVGIKALPLAGTFVSKALGTNLARI